MEDSKSFSLKLKFWRNSAGLSQEDLAHKANLSQSFLNKLENNKRNPPKREKIIEMSRVIIQTLKERGLPNDFLELANDLLSAANYAALDSTSSMAYVRGSPFDIEYLKGAKRNAAINKIVQSKSCRALIELLIRDDIPQQKKWEIDNVTAEFIEWQLHKLIDIGSSKSGGTVNERGKEK